MKKTTSEKLKECFEKASIISKDMNGSGQARSYVDLDFQSDKIKYYVTFEYEKSVENNSYGFVTGIKNTFKVTFWETKLRYAGFSYSNEDLYERQTYFNRDVLEYICNSLKEKTMSDDECVSIRQKDINEMLVSFKENFA